jgi:hypothetical protein
MPAAVAVAPVERPDAALRGVAKTCDASARPLGAEVLSPGCAPFDDRHRASGQDKLGADLMQGVGRNVLLAVVTDGGDIEPGEHAEDRNLRIESSTLRSRFGGCCRWLRHPAGVCHLVPVLPRAQEHPQPATNRRTTDCALLSLSGLMPDPGVYGSDADPCSICKDKQKQIVRRVAQAGAE